MGPVLLGALLVLLGIHVAEACLNFATAIRYPFELDYGEGIVWQQAELIPGPRMYSASTALPFIVFHYPPLYYLVVHVARLLQPDYLAAGRLVSALSTLPIMLSVTGIVLLATRRPGEARPVTDYAIALAMALLVLSLHAVRSWALLMRVDMLAVALATTGVLIAIWCNGRLWGTVCALLLCGAAVFTKQTELPAGVAVFAMTLLRNPRAALGAAAIAGSICLAALALMEARTGGGFLLNIIVYNMNPWAFWNGHAVLLKERDTLPIALLILLAAYLVYRRREQFGRGLLLIYFALASLMLVTIFKVGSNYNYLLDWLTSGTALLGIMLIDLYHAGSWRGWAYPVAIAAVILSVAAQPVHLIDNIMAADNLGPQEAMVRRIAAATKPVSAENMALVMRAGKQLYFEPMIAASLANAGIWDEGPLLDMIRSGGFAFMQTHDDTEGGNDFRSKAVDAAMRKAYPRVERVPPNGWLHLPAR